MLSGNIGCNKGSWQFGYHHRTVDAAGGDGVVLINDCVDPYNPKRSFHHGSDLRDIYRETKAENLLEIINRAGCHLQVILAAPMYYMAGGYDKTVGSESGVSESEVGAHSLIRIPMMGGAESECLSSGQNLIYEISRKR